MKSSQSLSNPFERLCGKSLTTKQIAEMRFSLSKYVEMLMQMDKQHREWLRRQARVDEKTGGSEAPPEVIN